MPMAYTMAPGRGDTDQLLHRVATSLMARGFHPAGTVQINSGLEGAGPCDMDVRVLPDGPTIRISQNLGAQARGCRLDPAALETAVARVQRSLGDCDGLIINKFGKHEAEGHGFRPVIADAFSMDLPVLVGLNALNEDAFLEFSAGMAERLDPDHDGILDWFGHGERQRAAS